MKNTLKNIVLAVSLVAVAQPAIAEGPLSKAGRGEDMYQFEHKQIWKGSVQVEMVLVNSKGELREQARKMGVQLPFGTKSFSALRPDLDYKVCTIYTLHPEADYVPEMYGHELMHCFFGDWHPEQNNIR